MYPTQLNNSDDSLASMSLLTRPGSIVFAPTDSLCVIDIIAPMQADSDAQLCEICPQKTGS